MRILHISDFGSTGFSGIREVVVATAQTQISLGHDVRVGLLSPSYGFDSTTYYYIDSYKRFKKYILDFKPDIVIFHGLFYYIYSKIYKLLSKQNIPYIIKLHGAASYENINKNFLKKFLAVKLKFGSFIRKASTLSFLNEEEKSNFSLSRYNNNYIIEPNGIYSIVAKDNYVIKNKINFSFIGRIDYYHKGLDILLKAIKILNDNPIKAAIEFNFYGPLYDDTFKEDILPYKDFVRWHPPVSGEEKKNVYKQADVFLLTSRFEGMPMGILEALSFGVPCLITPQTNMSKQIRFFNSGWVTDLDEYKIAECIENIVKEIRTNYKELSENANKTVKKYLWEEIIKRSIIQYDRIILSQNEKNLYNANNLSSIPSD